MDPHPESTAFPEPEGSNQPGLTKREYMATHILAGLASSQYQLVVGNTSIVLKSDITQIMGDRDLATNAVSLADALIRALNDSTKRRHG